MIKSTRKVKSTTVKTATAAVEPVKIPVAAAKATPAPAAKVTAPATQTTRVSFQLIKPGAKQVCVAGTFNGWKPERAPLRPVGEGRFAADLAVDPGRYEYLFVVDGQWLPDPNAKESVQNPFGGKNSVLTVSA
jgi:1,4-alpha-glucan branching enzyme